MEIKNRAMSNKSDEKYHWAGWGLFIVCAIFFLVSSWKNRDGYALIASIVFLVACLVFMVPLVNARKRR